MKLIYIMIVTMILNLLITLYIIGIQKLIKTRTTRMRLYHSQYHNQKILTTLLLLLMMMLCFPIT